MLFDSVISTPNSDQQRQLTDSWENITPNKRDADGGADQLPLALDLSANGWPAAGRTGWRWR